MSPVQEAAPEEVQPHVGRWFWPSCVCKLGVLGGSPRAAGDADLTLTLFPDRSKVPWNTGLRVMTSSG